MPRGAKKEEKTETIVLEPRVMRILSIPISGLTELIMHKWSEKAKREMLERQMGKKTRVKAPKDPKSDFEATMYKLTDGTFGMPTSAFKAAIIGGAREFSGVTMVGLKAALHVEPDGFTAEGEPMVRIIGEPRMREDMVRLESGVADIRHRAGFLPWSATIRVSFNERTLNAQSVLALTEAAGDVGIGDWRPTSKKSTGPFGRFVIDRSKTVTSTVAQAPPVKIEGDEVKTE